MIKRVGTAVFGSIAGLLFAVLPAFAHVVVKPSQVGVAAFQTFTVGVPNEKDNPVVALRLVIPEGLKSVAPNVKSDWKIDVKKSGEGEDAAVAEIVWTGGSVPPGQRDDFLLSAQVPAEETTINWKAYQTYQNGTVVSWDQAPPVNQSAQEREKMEEQGLGPYSETKVVNDLKAVDGNQIVSTTGLGKESNRISLALSIVALFVSVTTLGIALNKR